MRSSKIINASSGSMSRANSSAKAVFGESHLVQAVTKFHIPEISLAFYHTEF